MRRKNLAIFLSFLVPVATGACDFDSSGFGLGDGDGSGPGMPWPEDDDPAGPDERECFYGADDSDTPAAVIEHSIEVVEGVDTVHVELILDPRFVDNTYGATSVGWENSKKGGHTFKELVGSDRAELLLTDGNDALAMDIVIDYLTADDASPSGYRSMGVLDGDGEVVVGDPADVLHATSSLDRNLNERGYGSFTEDSPETSTGYTPNPAAPDWDYRVVYEAWVALDAFGAAGFGEPSIEYIHASPAKGEDNTIIVDPRPCPTDWCLVAFDCEPECNDPDGCDPGDPGDPGDPDGCTDDSDCPTGEFCGEEGTCLPDIG